MTTFSSLALSLAGPLVKKSVIRDWYRRVVVRGCPGRIQRGAVGHAERLWPDHGGHIGFSRSGRL